MMRTARRSVLSQEDGYVMGGVGAGVLWVGLGLLGYREN